MGLDTSHDCWHGPYSAFMRWREHLNYYIAIERAKDSEAWQAVSYLGTTRAAISKAWEDGLYDDQADALNVLMRHSDCEGEIPPEVCAPMAAALQRLMDERMPARALYDTMRPATERFIAGLRLAASRNEPVHFH